MSNPDWVLLHDEGTGFGHRHRMRALAERMTAHGCAVVVEPLPSTSRAAKIVVDSYIVRADDTSLFSAEIVVAFDDLHRDLRVDCVVDPSPGATACPHRAPRRVLAGATYTVIDPRVTQLSPSPIGDKVSRVIVFCGGSDHDGVAAMVGAEIARRLPDLDVVVPAAAARDDLTIAGVRVVDETDGLAPHLANADLVVSGGGLTMCEALALGRPTIAVMMAENQRTSIDHVSQVGAAVAATPDSAAEQAIALVHDVQQRHALARRGPQTVDGHGADRVAETIIGLDAA